MVSMGAAAPAYQRIFDALSSREGVELRVLGPRKGFVRYYGITLELRKSTNKAYRIVGGRIVGAACDIGGPYLTGLAREIVRFRPDVLHVQNEAYTTSHLQALLYRNLLRPSAKCFCQGAENMIDPAPRSGWEALKRRLVNKYCDGVACWSTSGKRALQEAGFPAEKLHVTGWGISLNQFRPGSNADLRDRLGLKDAFVVGFVGNLDIQKGLWTLLLALRETPEPVKSIWVGEGRWRATLERKIREFGLQGRVILAGKMGLEQVPAYLHAMDALVLPSETTWRVVEQFGRVLVEAMACGLPVIGSDCGAIPETIGEAGLVFPERDFVALAGCIRRLMTKPELGQKLAKAGMQRAASEFSCEAFASRLLDLYGETRR